MNFGFHVICDINAAHKNATPRFGIFGALAATRLVAALLYGLTPEDPVAFCAAGTIMLIMAVVASYVPASRATKVDPMLALRYE